MCTMIWNNVLRGERFWRVKKLIAVKLQHTYMVSYNRLGWLILCPAQDYSQKINGRLTSQWKFHVSLSVTRTEIHVIVVNLAHRSYEDEQKKTHFPPGDHATNFCLFFNAIRYIYRCKASEINRAMQWQSYIKKRSAVSWVHESSDHVNY
jgi:hypothetical protein